MVVKKQCAETLLNFVWKTKVKILAVYLCHDKCASRVEENWAERIQAIKGLIFTRGKRNLSIVGKYIIKTFLISQLVYIMKVLVLTDINRLLFRFLWRKKEEDCNRKDFEKVKRLVMCNDFGNGGLKMTDLKQVSLLLHWVVRLCRAQTWEIWAWTPKILYMFFGSRYDCFYSNVDNSKCKTLPEGKPNVNSGLFV